MVPYRRSQPGVLSGTKWWCIKLRMGYTGDTPDLLYMEPPKIGGVVKMWKCFPCFWEAFTWCLGIIHTHRNWLTFGLFVLAALQWCDFLTDFGCFSVLRFSQNLLKWGNDADEQVGFWYAIPKFGVICPSTLGQYVTCSRWSLFVFYIWKIWMKWLFMVTTSRHRSFNLKPHATGHEWRRNALCLNNRWRARTWTNGQFISPTTALWRLTDSHTLDLPLTQ